VVKEMAKNKPCGPNGFTIEFYQASWSFMSQDLVELVEESRCTKRMHPTLNTTFLDLILKMNKLEEP